MEELGQLIFVALFILFGLISGAKKKRKTPKQRAEPRQSEPEMQESDTEPERAAAFEATRPDTRPHQAREAPGYADRMVAPKRSVADELLALLQQQQQGEQVREPSVRLPEVDDEAESLETLEPAGGDVYEEAIELGEEPQAPARSPYSAWEAVSQRPYALESTTVERPYRIEETPEPEPYSIRESSRRKRNLSRRELRHAFVMREVLGPPKALE